jgi:hypothetical protein
VSVDGRVVWGSDGPLCIILIVVEHDGSLALVVEPTRTIVSCPQRGELSRRQHSWYERCPLDLLWRGQTVRMRVHCRRWSCDVPTCPRKIFAERFDGVLAHYARRTNGTTELPDDVRTPSWW